MLTNILIIALTLSNVLLTAKIYFLVKHNSKELKRIQNYPPIVNMMLGLDEAEMAISK